jgi:protein EFR3
MNIDNVSLQSLGRFNRAVGVTELREALEGRSSMSNSALVNKPASVSTLDNSSSLRDGDAGLGNHMGAPPSKARSYVKKKLPGAPGDVRDALNKLGVGGGSRPNRAALRTSFSIQKTEMR